MALTTASVLKDGTVGTTGGTATGFITKGIALGIYEAIIDDSSEFLTQSTVTFTTKDPKVNAGSPNGYTQARSQVTLKVPLELDNGEHTVNTLRIELSCDHEATDAEIESMLVYGAQFLADSDFSDFWKKQSIS